MADVRLTLYAHLFVMLNDTMPVATRDFDRTSDGRQIKILSIIDEYTRECLMLKVCRKVRSWEVVDALSELFLAGRMPKHIRSDNGSEFIAERVRKWLYLLEVKPLYIEPGSP